MRIEFSAQLSLEEVVYLVTTYVLIFRLLKYTGSLLIDTINVSCVHETSLLSYTLSLLHVEAGRDYTLYFSDERTMSVSTLPFSLCFFLEIKSHLIFSEGNHGIML